MAGNLLNALLAAAVVADQDLNGDAYIAGAEGEREEDLEARHALIPDGYPAATAATFMVRIAYTGAQAQRIISLNYVHQLMHNVPPAAAADIAFLRFLMFREGLASPEMLPGDFFVLYNDAKRVSEPDGNAMLNIPKQQEVDALSARLTADRKAYLRTRFCDLVSCVAVHFRGRAHHFLSQPQGPQSTILPSGVAPPRANAEYYNNLWEHCLHVVASLGMTWEHISHNALHAIYPINLDRFLLDCVANGKVAGAIVKRRDIPAAGTASLFAVKRGIDDILGIFPGLRYLMEGAIAYLDERINFLTANRWAGSINARYYGAQRIVFDETELAAVAATVVGVYEQLAEKSPLRASPALNRVASSAPVTGGVIGLAARRAARDDKLSLISAAHHSEDESRVILPPGRRQTPLPPANVPPAGRGRGVPLAPPPAAQPNNPVAPAQPVAPNPKVHPIGRGQGRGGAPHDPNQNTTST